MAKRLTKKQISRRRFLQGLGAGALAGVAGTLGLQYTACREKKPEEISAFEIPYKNWMTVVEAEPDNVYMSRCGNFNLGAALLYLKDTEDVNHPEMDYKEKNKLIEREKKIGIHREKLQTTKDGKSGYTVRVVGFSRNGAKAYIEKVSGRQVRLSKDKSDSYAARPFVNVEDLGAELYRDTVITANRDIIDIRNLE